MSKKHHSKLSQAIGHIGEKQREKAGKAIKKIAKKLVHPFAVLLDAALLPGKLAMFAPMLPFVALMEAYLKKHNVSVPGNKLDHLENLCRQFYQIAILKQPPLTHGVGLADKGTNLEAYECLENVEFAKNVNKLFYESLMLESADDDSSDSAASGSNADKAVDKATAGIAKVGGAYGKIVATAIQIIHGIISFITGMKKKANAAKKGVTPTVAKTVDPAHDAA